jgi:putative hydrolase of the HAD superfamily
VAAFQFVIKENKLVPAETIFIDDTEANMAGATEAGLQIYHLTGGKTILDIKW